MDSKNTQPTTEAGGPVGDNQNSLTAGPRGPGLPSAWHLFTVRTTQSDLTPE